MLDALILAGGTGRRLGGTVKPELEVAGMRLLDRVLAAVEGCRRTVVIAPESVAVPAGVLRTLESPPSGGPVAGIAAGCAALQGQADPADGLLILACDMPGAAAVVAPLRSSFMTRPEGADGVIACDSSGRRQHLATVIAPAALGRALHEAPVRDRSMRSLLASLSLADVLLDGEDLEDVDTWQDHARWEQRLSGGRACP